jgi:beta-mannosidase
MRWLHEGWTVQPVGEVPEDLSHRGSVPATVPGCVHTDLLAAGLIEDPYLDTNEATCAWIGRTDWLYQQSFAIAEGALTERVDLVCQGLDTIATVTLNGVEIGRTENMHRGYRFDVRDVLRVGVNRLAVRFESAYAYAEAGARLGR